MSEYKKCNELIIGVNYPIEMLKNEKTKFGSSLVALIHDPSDGKIMYRVYLPKRYAESFNVEELNNLKRLSLKSVYHRRKERANDVEIVQ